MSAGDRGTGLSIMMTFLIIFGCFVKEINLKQFIVIATIGAFILTLIGIGRTSDSGGVLSSGIGSVSFASNYDVTLDLANSSRTLYMALSNVPSEHDYFFGKLWLGDLLASTPFAQGIYLEFSNDKSYEINSSAYITFITFGPNSTTGEGSTLIADIYLNFGVIGVIVSMFLLGLFLRKLQNELYLQQNFYWVITAGIMASYVFYMSRGGLLEGIRPILWGLILTIFFIKSKRIIL
jgi:oligosaccharide repeat unit polymerase